MFTRAPKDAGPGRRLLPSPSMVLAGVALSVALGGSAVAADHLIRSSDIAPGAVTGAKIRNATVTLADLQPAAVRSLRGRIGATGATGATGTPGVNGLGGTNGANGAVGSPGPSGVDGTDGTNGTDGADGVLGPLSATAGVTALPTATPPTEVVSLTVPAGNYVVLAKTQLSHTGAGDTVTCELKAGAVVIDVVAMKTLPALAAIPVSLQAVTTTSPTQLSLTCDVTVANGSATATSLIALPVG